MKCGVLDGDIEHFISPVSFGWWFASQCFSFRAMAEKGKAVIICSIKTGAAPFLPSVSKSIGLDPMEFARKLNLSLYNEKKVRDSRRTRHSVVPCRPFDSDFPKQYPINLSFVRSSDDI